jgi:hypothetical protein
MLAWLLLTACHAPPQALPEGQIVIGWRLAPGMELTYRLRSTHTLARDTVVREEVWRYLVRSADADGTFLLEGHLGMLDATMLQDGQPRDDLSLDAVLAEERARLEQQSTSLLLSDDGRIDRLDADEWSDALVQRLLALRLPTEPIEPGSRWTETDTARAFARLAPPGLEVTFGGTQRFEGLQWEPRDRPVLRAPATFLAARIVGEAMLRPADARYPAVDIQSTALWDLEAGRLASRSLQVIERGGTRPEQTGDLTIELERLPERRAAPRPED